MTIPTWVASRPNFRRAGQLAGSIPQLLKTALLGTVLVIGFETPGALAQAQSSRDLPPFVVENDPGGFIRNRLNQLRTLRASGQPVQIRGQICYSTCTMLLGLPNTCISPKTEFGFHGPSQLGRRLPPDRFEFFSRVIAQYYPQPLQDWYMTTGRTRLRKLYRISGTTIIDMGIKSCKDQGI